MKLGHNTVMKTVVAELKDLEENEILVGSDHFKSSFVSVLGDNLRTHGIGGFTENFSTSRYFSRYCEVPKENFQKSPH